MTKDGNSTKVIEFMKDDLLVQFDAPRAAFGITLTVLRESSCRTTWKSLKRGENDDIYYCSLSEFPAREAANEEDVRDGYLGVKVVNI